MRAFWIFLEEKWLSMKYNEPQTLNTERHINNSWGSFIYCSIIYNSQDTEANQVPINTQVAKKAVVHVCSGILLSHKKE